MGVGGVEVGSGLGMMKSGEQREWIHRAGRWCGTWRAALLLVALCLAVYLPGFFGIAAVDRDESRFAQASRQMLEAPDWHGWLIPKIQDRPRLNKPPLIYWLQAGSAAIFTQRWDADGTAASARDAIWMYRIPSLIAAIVIVLITWRMGLAMYDSRVATLAATLLAVCPVFVWEARQARADMVMVAATTGALWALWGLWIHRTRSTTDWLRVCVLWAALSVGVMTKGPVPLLVVVLAISAMAVLARDARWVLRLHPWLGAAIIALPLVPWVYLVARDVGFDAYRQIIFSETVERSMEAKEGHGSPPGYHLLMVVVLFLPGSLVAALAMARAWNLGLRRANAPRGSLVARVLGYVRNLRDARHAECFLLCVLVPGWIMFESIATKLPHYTMPLYPALALVSARAVLAGGAGRLPGLWSVWGRVGVRLWSVVAVGFGVAGGLAACATVRAVFGEFLFVALAILFASAFLAIMLHRAIVARRIVRVQMLGVLASIVATMLAGWSLPLIDEIRVSHRAARLMHERDPHDHRPIAMIGYLEDSLIFETRGRAERIEPWNVNDWIERHPSGMLVLEHSAAPPPQGWSEFARVLGFNYSKGKKVIVRLLEREP